MSKKPSNQFSWRHDDTLHVKSSERRTPSSDTSSTPPPLFNHVDSPLRRRSLESHWENEAIPAGPPSQAHARAVSTSSAASSTTSTSASAVMLSEETNPIVQEAILVGEDYHLDDEEVFEAIPITNLEAERTTSVGENQLAASTWLMSVESVESKPVIPGWYFAVGDASLSWVQFSSTHEASIEKAWMDGVSKTLMLFNGTKGDDKKIDLNRMYQKNRGGVRKPIIRIADSNEGKVDEPWLYQYCLDIDIAEDEFSGDEVGEWVEFDYQANNHINRCVLSGRENTVLYDDNFTILINVVERTWASPVKGENERSNLGFIARRGDVDALLPTLAVKDEVKGEGEQKEDDIFEAKLVMLEAMGFERRRAKAALVECSDVIDRAVAFLCNTTE